jgi:hypothetical protein
MAGWLRGLVKEVQGGDQVCIAASVVKQGPPPEKRLTLSSIVAPKLVSAPKLVCVCVCVCACVCVPVPCGCQHA